ncbi:hypothetical protein EEB14_63050, partial [Rhodococcus sp. WS4]
DLAARGYSRDGKKGCEQIEYGLLTDPEGRPVAVRVFPGNTADLSSSWVTGRHCDLAARGYSRDGKKGCEQIEYGLLTDPEGRP